MNAALIAANARNPFYYLEINPTHQGWMGLICVSKLSNHWFK